MSNSNSQLPNILNFSKNKIVANNAGSGGGLKIESAQPNIGINSNITQNVIASNKVTGQGGGIYFDIIKGNTTITNNSIVNNYAPTSSAMHIKVPEAVTVNYNTIVWNKTTGIAPTRAVYIQTTQVAPNHQFRYNNIYNSNCNSPFYELWFEGANNDSLNVRNCYWQQSTLNDVNAVIFDFLDSSILGRVNPDPFLTSPDITAPVTPVQNVTKTQVGSDVQLNWTANLETDITGYKAYWGNPTGYSFSNVVDVGNVTTYTVTNASVNDTIEVTAYDMNADGVDDQVEGNESWFKGDETTVFVPIALASNPTNASICSGQSITFTASGASTYEFFVNDTSVQGPGGSNTYTDSTLNDGDSVKVTGTNACGSATSAPIVVTVNPGPPPTVTVTSSVPSICTGDTAMLTASGATTYSWSPVAGLNSTTGDTVLASPLATTTYTVTGTSGGCTNTAAVTLNVNPAPPTPTITASGPTTFCQGDSVVLTSSSAVSYNWSNGATTQSITVNSSGSYTVTVTDINGCSAVSAPTSVTVNPLPFVNAGADKTICSGQSTVIGSLSVAGNTYSWSPSAGLSSATVSNPTATPVDTTTYILTQTITATGCYNKDTVVVTVNPLPAAIAGTMQTLCYGDSVGIGDSTVPGNTYQWSPSAGLSSDSVSNPLASPSSTTLYTLTETITATGCFKSDTVTVMVNSLPNVTLSAFSSVCVNAPAFTLTGGTPGGGLYSGTGVSGGTFTPSSAGTGTHTITYTYTDGNGCSDSASQTLTVNPLPAVSFASLPALCINDSALTLSGGSPPGGVYSGTGVSGGGFYPSVAGGGTHAITYTYTDTNSCVNQVSQNIVVNNLPAVTFASLPPVCISTPLVVLSGGFPGGGIYSGNGVFSGNFYPSIAGLGTHIITYTYTDGNNCTNSDTSSIQVLFLPNQPVIITYDTTAICVGGSILLTTSAEAGVTYQWLLNSSNIPGATDTFYIASQIGDYTVEATNLCGTIASSPVTLTQNPNAAPNVTLAPFDTVCLLTSPFALSGGSPSGGVYSGTGVSGGIFDPAAAGLGTHTIIYSYTDSSGCSGNASQNITVSSSAPVTFTTLSPVCDNSQSFVLSGGLPPGGVYSGPGVSSGTFEPSVAGPGMHDITYTYTDSVCTGFATQQIIVNPAPFVTLDTFLTVCLNGPGFVLTGGSPSGGTYSGLGVLNEYFYPSLAGDGMHIITYAYTDSLNCSASASQNIAVSDSIPPEPLITGNTVICKGQSAELSVQLQGGNSYLWSTGDTINSITVTPASGTVYSVTVSNNCGSAASYTVVSVNDIPYVTAEKDTTIALGTGVQIYAGGGITYNWTPLTGLSCTDCPSPVASPEQTTTYVVTGTDVNGCSEMDSVTVSVDPDAVIFIPEVFSPNYDGANDLFNVMGKGIQTLWLVVYDRWGNKVFETTDITQSWDGTYNGIPVSEGVYVYYMKAILYNEQDIVQKGDVTIVR